MWSMTYSKITKSFKRESSDILKANSMTHPKIFLYFTYLQNSKKQKQQNTALSQVVKTNFAAIPILCLGKERT